MNAQQLYERYLELQRYVGWTEADAQQVRALRPVVEPHFPAIIDDFYAEIDRHPGARKVITGGAEQIARLKGTLRAWVEELFTGPYDADFVERRFRVGLRHVDIGLEQVYTNVALSRIRTNLVHVVCGSDASPEEKVAAVESLNRLLDLDLAIIEDAYQAEYHARQQRTERLATLGQVAAGVAHELRNPLNAVKTSVYYLLNARNPSPEKTAEHLERIDRQVGIADGVITALSDFAKLPMPNLRPAVMCECIRLALDANPLPADVTVTVDCPDALPRVLVDESQIAIVLGNLIRNARDAMPEGGRLTLTGRDAGDSVELDVADTGNGIPPEALKKVMEPLYTTKARGIGLGLAITRSIVEKHGGELCAKSQPGEGTTFTLYLPRGPQSV